jgi:hypothetical protein
MVIIYVCLFHVVSIESHSSLTPKDLMECAVQVIIAKCQNLRAALNDAGLVSTMMEE